MGLFSVLRKLDGFPWRHLEGGAHIPLSTVTELKPPVLNSVWVKVSVEEVFCIRGVQIVLLVSQGEQESQEERNKLWGCLLKSLPPLNAASVINVVARMFVFKLLWS